MHHPSARVTEHAKLLSYGDRQVLAYIYRDEGDAMCVVLQMWVAATDEQIRAVVKTDSDEDAILFFDGISDLTLPKVIADIGIMNELVKLERALS